MLLRLFRLVGSLLLLLVLVITSNSGAVFAKQNHQAVLKVRPGESARVRVKLANDPKTLVQEIELEASSSVLSLSTSADTSAQSPATLTDGSYNCAGTITAYGAFNIKLWTWSSVQNYRIVQGNLYIDTHTSTAAVYYIGWRYDHQTY